jgi:hypothetical protein
MYSYGSIDRLHCVQLPRCSCKHMYIAFVYKIIKDSAESCATDALIYKVSQVSGYSDRAQVAHLEALAGSVPPTASEERANTSLRSCVGRLLP